MLHRTLLLDVCTLLHTRQHCVEEIRYLCLCWNQGKGIIELRLGELDGSNRSMWDTCAAGVRMWKTHQLSKRIKFGVPSLGIKVERYRAQGWVYTLWLIAIRKSGVKLLESRVECPTLWQNLSVHCSSLFGTTIWTFSSQTHRDFSATPFFRLAYRERKKEDTGGRFRIQNGTVRLTPVTFLLKHLQCMGGF